MINQKSSSKIVVLLVDDQRFIAAALGQLLTNERDIALHFCQHATKAVALANEIQPSVILQDLVLPDIDGLTMVRRFRENGATAHTPVIVLSASDDHRTRANAMAAGARDYLVKLPDREELVACIRRHAAGSGAVPAAERTSSVDETLGVGVLDELREAGGGTLPDFAVMLIDQFVDEATAQVTDLRGARLRGDAPALKATLHGLKGSSLTMGARRLAGLCAGMEQQLAVTGEDELSGDQMVEIDMELVRVLASLAVERQQATSGGAAAAPGA
jgi:DNA-binding response OmpR family regulator